MRLNINTALITSKQKGNQNIAVISNYFWFDYSLKPYVSCIDAVFTESEERVKGKGTVYGYFIYSLLNIAHNYEIRPDTHYPTVLGENESEKPFSAIPVAKKGLMNLFINILPSAIDGLAVSYRLVSDGRNIGFGVKDVLKVGEDIYKVYPNFLRVMKLPDEDLLIKRANFPVRVKIKASKKGKKGGDISVELPTLIDGLFSKTLNKHIGVIPDRVLNSPRLEHLPQDWIIWEDYRPVICGQALDTYELITPPDEDVLDFVNYLKSTYNKPVYLLVSVEFLLGSTITYLASVENVSQFINSLPVDGVVIQDDFSEGSWVAGTVNPAISTFLRNLYSQINKPKFYLPSYSTVKHVSFQNNAISITTSRNQLFNQTKHGCIYTPPLIPFKECGYTYGGYNANTCDHANYYLQKENKPVLKYEEFMQVYPSLTFIDEPDKMYKPPNLLLDGLNNIVLKQHTFDKDMGLVQFPDVKMGVEYKSLSFFTVAPVKYTYSDLWITYDRNNFNLQFYIQKHYVDGRTELASYQKLHTMNFEQSYDQYFLEFFASPYLGAFYLFGKHTAIEPIQVVRPILVESPVFVEYPVLDSGISVNSQNRFIQFYIDFQDLGRLVIEMDYGLTNNDYNPVRISWQPQDVSPEISARRKAFECQILQASVYIEIFLRNFNDTFDNSAVWRITWLQPRIFIKHQNFFVSGWAGGDTSRGFISLDIANMKEIRYHIGLWRNQPYVFFSENDLIVDLDNIRNVLHLNEGFFSTVSGVRPPPAINKLNGCLWQPSNIQTRTTSIRSDTCLQNAPGSFTYQTGARLFGISTPYDCNNTLTNNDFEASIERIPPLFSSQPVEIETVLITLQSAFYYQVYSLNHLASQLRNKTVFWNAFYLTPFWQVFTFNQGNTITFYYTRIPYNFLVYFINVEADNEQVNCCINPRIVRDRPPNEEIGLNISIPQLPISNVFTGGNEGQFTWLTPEQSSLLNPYNYVNSKLTAHKPFLIPLYEKFYRRVDKYTLLEPVLAYVKGGQVYIIGQYKGIFAYTLPEYTDKVFLAVYRESANELILAIGEDLIMADVIEYEDVSLGILTSQENPFVFYKTHITKTGEIEPQNNTLIIRFVDLP